MNNIDETQIAETFYKIFTEIGLEIDNEIEKTAIKFDDYLEQCDTVKPYNALSIMK